MSRVLEKPINNSNLLSFFYCFKNVINCNTYYQLMSKADNSCMNDLHFIVE